MAGGSARRRVPFLGLTGGIGAGKTEALHALERLGAATLSSDAIVHDLLEHDEEVRRRVVDRFGTEVAPDGRLDRSRLGDRVFEDPEARRWLEALLWPRVANRIAAWREELEALDSPPRAAAVEVPLLFEAGMDGAFDATVAIVADEDVRARRAGGRGHAGVESRAGRQLPQAQKAERADHAIANDGDLDDLRRKMSDLLGKIGA